MDLKALTSTFNARLAIAIVTTAGLAVAGGYGLVQALGTGEGREPLPAARDYAASAAASGSSQQQAALEDGEVTLAEYNTAVADTVACVRAAGVAAAVVPGEGLRPASVTFTASGSLADAEAARAVLDACKGTHLRDIETVWALQQAESPDAQAAAHIAVSECIEGRGFDLGDGLLSVDDLNALMLSVSGGGAEASDRALYDAYRQCRDSAAAETGYSLP